MNVLCLFRVQVFLRGREAALPARDRESTLTNLSERQRGQGRWMRRTGQGGQGGQGGWSSLVESVMLKEKNIANMHTHTYDTIAKP